MKHHFHGILLSMVCVLTGCSCVHPAAQNGKTAINTNQRETTLIYRQPVQPLRWSKVIIEPVSWQATTPCHHITAERQTLLRFHLENALTRELKGNDPHGPVLRIQTAITDVKPVSPLLNATTAALILVPVQSGGSAIRLTATDTATNRLYLDVSLADNAGLYDLNGHFAEWAHSETTIDRIAQRTRTLLEKNDGSH